MAENLGVYINDRGTMYTIRDQEAYDTANEAKALAEEAKGLAEDLAEEIEHLAEPIEFNIHAEFPNIGDAKKLYVATDEDKIYRWDSTQLIYICIGSASGMDIDVIQGIL